MSDFDSDNMFEAMGFEDWKRLGKEERDGKMRRDAEEQRREAAAARVVQFDNADPLLEADAARRAEAMMEALDAAMELILGPRKKP